MPEVAMSNTIALLYPPQADNELVAKKRNGRKGKRAVEEIYADIGKVVAEFRINRRMSLQDVASQIGMSEAQLSRVESGKSRLMIHDMLRIARVIGVSTAEILRDFEEQES
jgi:ribosome-binding protein aMBF1 (putative translation factor)